MIRILWRLLTLAANADQPGTSLAAPRTALDTHCLATTERDFRIGSLRTAARDHQGRAAAQGAECLAVD